MKLFAQLLQTKLDIENFVWHHCSAHKIERIIHHAKRGFSNFKKVQKMVNQGASFYKRSHVRNNHLHDFINARVGENEKAKFFKLMTIYPIRWVDSSYKAHRKLLTNWETIVKHLQEMQNPSDLLPKRKFDKKSLKKALKLENFYRDKNALMTMFLSLDVLEHLKKESLIFQIKGSSLLGQSERQKHLKKNIRKLAKNDGGKWTKKFLRKSICQRQAVSKTGTKISLRKQKCMTLERFTTSFVTWNGIFLIEDMKKFKPVATFIEDFFNKIQEELELYMPDNQGLIHDLKLLNHQTWPSDLKDVIAKDDYKENIRTLAKWFNMENDTPLLCQYWESLFQILAHDKEYLATLKILNPTAFWEKIFSHRQMDPIFIR